jgi:hypothetical protein
MGLLDIFSKQPQETHHLVRLPSGTVTVDAQGNIITSTLPRSFPEDLVHEIAAHVLELFRGAKTAQSPLTEMVIQFASLKITAREQRGGALIFLAPETGK